MLTNNPNFRMAIPLLAQFALLFPPLPPLLKRVHIWTPLNILKVLRHWKIRSTKTEESYLPKYLCKRNKEWTNKPTNLYGHTGNLALFGREERSIEVVVAFNLYISNIMDWYMVSLLSAKIYSWIGDRRCFDFDSFDEIFLLLYLLQGVRAYTDTTLRLCTE